MTPLARAHTAALLLARRPLHTKSTPTNAVRVNATPTIVQKKRPAVLSLTPAAVARLKHLRNYGTAGGGGEGGPNRILKIGVDKKGCSGLAYAISWVTEKSKYDEEVSQDGVRLLVDGKALLSILGSEMDFLEDKISSQFVFHNPNVKTMCGCGHSFSV